MSLQEEKIFECIKCTKFFSKRDIKRGKYFISTNICKDCYDEGARLSRKIWCFGKKQTEKLPGYSNKNKECASSCPDREICKIYTSERNR